ncbi:hypothetical protein [Chlorogloea sp. CCALA 695]|uniref:hypothetical protein n=1 Tax=Chlorogloea sp. CCALA 695 TaxID=2107693 RepID=UPI0018EAB1E7|nr:hypothetical protein [Chlorogloea sp. CCALA 695]
MSNDALERIKQRQRPSVPTRDLSLIPENADILISSNLENENNISLGSVIPSNIEERKLGAKTSIQTKQTTMRLEVKVSERLSSICRANELSREVFLEALFEYYEVDPDAWNKILVEAKIKGEQRQNLANLKRAQSMMQRFGE